MGMQNITPSDRPRVRWILKRDTVVPLPAWGGYVEIRSGVLKAPQRDEHQHRLRYRSHLGKEYNVTLHSIVTDARYLRVPSSDRLMSSESRWIHDDRLTGRWGKCFAILVEISKRIPSSKIEFTMARPGLDEKVYRGEGHVSLT